MAATDRFLIAPMDGGLQTDLKPWLIPDNAFQELTNAYVFRGRVRKKFGAIAMNPSVSGIQTELSTRLRVNLGNTDGSGNISVTVPGVDFNVGQMFSIGTQLFTVVALGTPGAMLKTGSATLATFNTTSGALVIHGAAITTAVYYYPALPVTGLTIFDTQNIGNNPTFAFDPQFAYEYTNGAWTRLSAEATIGAATWNGDALGSQLVWSYNWIAEFAYQPILYVTNYNYGSNLSNSDLMRFWDGTQWNFFNPGFSSGTATDTIVTCRIMLPFKNRLVLLNVVENTGNSPGTNQVYVNRARWSWAGDPTDSSAFFDDIDGYGSYADAPTTEAIITAQFLKDRLIVYFESSTWELVYTGNQIQPFLWQQINTELGAQSTFSEVPFDKVVLGIGNTGVHACNGSNVDRIDNKIPEKVFDITPANLGLNRVYGIRDYYSELVYWTFPSETFNQVYPNRILTYNYKTGSWAFFNDSFTAFGYYEQQPNQTWANSNVTWAENGQSWDSGTDNLQFKQVIAGNQEGFVMRLNADASFNEATLYITNMVNSGGTEGGTLITITCFNHNLVVADQGDGNYIMINGVQGMTGINDVIYPINTVSSANLNTFTIVVPEGTTVSGTYTGGGVITKVDNINIVTKQYNFYAQDGRNSTINKVDFLFDRTFYGQVTVDYSVSSSSESLLDAGAETGTLVNTGVVETSPYQATINIGNTDTSGNAAGIAPAGYYNIGDNIEVIFIIGPSVYYSVSDSGALTRVGGSTGSGTFNRNTGAYTFTSATIDTPIIIGKPSYPIESTQARIWHPIYPFAEGECIQLKMYMSEAQITTYAIALAGFTLHSILFLTSPTSNRFQ